jgi:hypothetical protein
MKKNAFTAGPEDVMLFRLELDADELGYLRSLLEVDAKLLQRRRGKAAQERGFAIPLNSAIAEVISTATKKPVFKKRATVRRSRAS